MNQNNEQVYKMVERIAEKVVGLGTTKTKKVNQVGCVVRGCAVGVFSSWLYAQLLYFSGLPP